MKLLSVLMIVLAFVLVVITIVVVLVLTIGAPNGNSRYMKDGIIELIEPNIHHRPKIIMTYWKPIPRHVLQMLETYAPEFDLDFYDDTRAGAFIEKYFMKQVRNKFDSFLSNKQGAHASDLFRFCALATLPGRNLYLDVKTVLKVPIVEWFPLHGTSVVAVRASGPVGTTHIGITGGPHQWQGWLAMVNRIMKTPVWVSKMSYHTHCYQFTHHVADDDVTWLHSRCDINLCTLTGGRDRYGLCCVIEKPGDANDPPRIVMYSRDPKYPY